ncbi:aminoglycoside phosphotransferase family protein [Halalkalibacter wakoensis JCM 9140]|uniref:Aminoglycoside phosphotransferase family protein n=1 Tax=Halalkalibacter wakoensis JCM 9140 TaxID=1236970 RepID=W4Q1E4_9BACI|nr:phosphotransferase family protein [Halalkalibacter wakoensis]GAE25792.1 aminoglycoside phosphotransferase family protein [Halalkalibacter wakoensis JCM 9140]
MEQFLGDGWKVQPAGGATGEAYIAQQGEQTVFLKRNSSPFLAVLSAEGIVPKLLWTRRLENGDVVTAQRWVQGRELKAYEMKESRVAALLAKIHGSSELLDMFKRIGNEPLTPYVIVENLRRQLQFFQIEDETIEDGMKYLLEKLESVLQEHFVVCHCDINHNNWMLDEEEQLYLIDWDGATVSDPALDLGLLLYSYIPEHEWEYWLEQYGVVLEDSLRNRMHWYVVSQSISVLLWHFGRGQFEQAEQLKEYIRSLLEE